MRERYPLLLHRLRPVQNGPVDHVVRLVRNNFSPDTVLEAVLQPMPETCPPAYGISPSEARIRVTDDSCTAGNSLQPRREPAMTSKSKWAPEAIRALGPTTDLPTLGAIFECSRWKSYQMARQNEWQQVGIKVLSIGSKYRVVVQSILDVLGYGSADVDAPPADLDPPARPPISARQVG
jgi:hypothetical protein